MRKTTVLGLAPPSAGSAPAPTRSLTPTGRYRLKLASVETVKLLALPEKGSAKPVSDPRPRNVYPS